MPVSPRNATSAPTSTSPAPPNACEPSPASSSPSSVASIARNASSPTVSAITARSQPGGMLRIHGSHSIPSATGMTPTYTPSSAIRPKNDRSAVGVSTATGISCAIVPPDDVSSTTSYASPSTHGCETRTVAVSSRPTGDSPPVNCANASLTTACAIVTASGPSLRTVSSIVPGSRTVLLHHQLLRRRPAALAQARAVEQRERRHRRHDQQQRHEPERPRRHARERERGRATLHHETSKKPCQPSSVNSDWWAWNMNLPGCRKRHSRIPRWPWQSITVSVSSDGVFDVPVGK